MKKRAAEKIANKTNLTGEAYLDSLMAMPLEEMVIEMIPHLATVPVEKRVFVTEIMAGIMSGILKKASLEGMPEWAKNASQQFWQSILGSDLIAKFEAGDLRVLGKILSFLELFQPRGVINTKFESALRELPPLIKAEGTKLNAEDNLKFAIGRVEGTKVMEHLDNLPQKTHVLAIIAGLWREIEKFKSAGELHRWLLAEKIILPQTDAAETRKICREIGLKFPGKPGRPSRKITEDGKSGVPKIA